MGEALVTVTFEAVSGVAEDRIVNTFPISTPSTVALATPALIESALNGFYYDDHAAGTFSIGDKLSPFLSRAINPVWRMYDVGANLSGTPISGGGIPAGSPLHQGELFLLPPSDAGTPLPEECAIVLTSRGGLWETALVEQPDADVPPDAKVDRPKQRRSGRLYLGPWNTSAGTGDGANRSRPIATLLSCILGAGFDFQTELNATAYEHCVWSRKDAMFRPISAYQVDDSWDTQRRRGVRPTARNTLAV